MSIITVTEGQCIHHTDVPDGTFSDLEKLCNLSDRFTRVRDGVIVDGCIADGRFSDGTTLIVKPKGVPDGSISRMLCPIFGLEVHQEDSLFEFLIMLFVRDVRSLMRKGLRSAYTTVRANENSFKGRMLFSEHIRENLVHKERVFVEYEIFSPDRAENRLIVGILGMLLKRSTNSRNRMDIRTILQCMEEIPPSQDLARDMSKINLDRNMADYVSVMSWCEIFLNSMGLGDSDSSFILTIDHISLEEAFVARMSSYNREDGSFSAKCHADVSTDGRISFADVIIDWRFYDIRTRIQMTDAEKLFLTSPGVRSLPITKDHEERIEDMAVDYLLDPLGGII